MGVVEKKNGWVLLFRSGLVRKKGGESEKNEHSIFEDSTARFFKLLV
jgi:hypothetical protein